MFDNMPIATDELSKNAMGGTEMMKYGLEDRIDSKLLDHFHITANGIVTGKRSEEHHV